MADENVGTISYTLDAKTDALITANNKAQKSIDGVEGSLDNASKSADKFDGAIKKTAEEIKKANGWYEDANGRLRDMKGRFVSAARQAEAFGDDIEGASRKSKTFSFNLTKVASGVGVATRAIKTGTIATTALVAAFTAIVNKSAEVAREISLMAQLSGVTVERFQELAFGAKSVGISSEKLGDIFKDVQDKVGDFLNTGGGELKDYFENIAPLVGQTADEFAGLSGPDALIKFKEGLDAANLSASEQIFYLESLANDAALLSPLLANNAQGFEDAAAKANELNAVLSETEIKELTALKSEFDALFSVVGTVTQKIVADFAPSIISALKSITRFVGSAGKAIEDFFDLFQDPENINNIDTLETRLSELEAKKEDLISRESRSNAIVGQLKEVDKQIAETKARIAELKKEKDSLNDGETLDELEVKDTKLEGDRLKPISIFDTPAGQPAEQFSIGESSQLSSSGQTSGAAGTSQFVLDMQEGLNVSQQMAQQIETVDQKFQNLGTTMSDTLVSAAYSFSDAMGQGLAQAIADGDSLNDALGDVASTIGVQLLGSLITMGLQYGINAALATAAGSAVTSATAAQAAATQTAWAPAALSASIATSGGAVTAGTSAYSTAMASNQAISIAGGRLNGGPVSAGSAYEVTEDGKPEMLTVGGKNILMMGNQSGTVTSNKDLTSGSSGGGVVVNIQNNASGSEATATSTQQDGKTIIDVVVADLNNRGKIHKTMTNTTTANNKV